MAITFDNIPFLIYTPGVFAEFDPTRAVKGVAIQPHDTLIVAQKLAAGAIAANTVEACDSVDEGRILGGEGSQLALAVAAAKAADPLTQLYVIGVPDDGSGVAATGSIVFTGTSATESGEIAVYVAGRRISIACPKGTTPAQLETAGLAAFALVRDLPVTVAADAAAGLDFTARNAGTIGNSIRIGVSQLPGERVPAGITATVTAMASGATDPSYASAITAMADDQYHTVVSGLATATPLGLLVTEFEARSGPMRMIEGQIFAAAADSRANLTTLGNSLNSFALTLIGMEVSALIPTPAEVAASVAGLNARRTQTSPGRALTGAVLPGISGAKRGSRFTRAERDILLSDGVSTVKAGPDGRMHVERLVTTYQSNQQGFPDTALQDLTTLRLLAALRYSARVRFGTKFAQFLLTSDGAPVPPGVQMVQPSTLRAECLVLYGEWVALGWVEGAALAQFKSELIVERSEVDPNRVDFLLPPDLVNNLLVSAMKIAFKR